MENGTKIGEMVLSITDDVITVYHTEIVQEHNGKGYAQVLLDELVLYTAKKSIKSYRFVLMSLPILKDILKCIMTFGKRTKWDNLKR